MSNNLLGYMRGIPGKLLFSLKQALISCDEFYSPRQLRSIFSSAELKPWQNALPTADNPREQVDITIDYLARQERTGGEPVLPIFLKTLSEHYDLEDKRHSQLLTLSDQLARIWQLSTETESTTYPEVNFSREQILFPPLPFPQLNSSPFPVPREPSKEPDTPPHQSKLKGNYNQLRELLVAKEWKKADIETAKVILEVAQRQKEGWLRTKDIQPFPCADLCVIDNLWKKLSEGRFGFSIQRDIWLRIGGQSGEYDGNIFPKFGDHIDWCVDGRWLEYDALFFTLDALQGHLPSFRLTTLKSRSDWFGLLKDNFRDFLPLFERCLAK